MTAFTFDWQKLHSAERGHKLEGTEEEKSFQRFLVWLLPEVLPSTKGWGEEKFVALSDKTEKFTKCKITMQINGEEVDAESMLRGIRRTMELSAVDEAKRMLAEANLDQLHTTLDAMQRGIEDYVRAEMAKIEIELPREDEW